MRGFLGMVIFGGLISLAAGNNGLTKKEITERAARKELGLLVTPVRVVDNVNDAYRIAKRIAKSKQSTSAGIVANIDRPFRSNDGYYFPTRFERDQWERGKPCAWKRDNGLCGGY